MIISKSKYMLGLQCPKLLWVNFNAKELIPDVDPTTQRIFDQGHSVGDLAKSLYPSGVEVPYGDFGGTLNETSQLVFERKTIFEASFLHHIAYCRVDVLLPVGEDEWDIIEVKSSTRVKDVNIDDVAFQKYVLEGCGLKIRKCLLMHVNNQYVRNGDVEADKLLVSEDITSEVGDVDYVKDKIDEMVEIIEGECPSVDVGPQGNTPYSCPLGSECCCALPDGNVTELYYIGAKAYELTAEGVVLIEDIPDNFQLTEKQMIQRQSLANGVHIDKDGIKEFLFSFKEPLYFLDFETFSSAVPAFDGVRPYQQVPFQFSLHAGDEHYEFLGDGVNDPRKDMIDALKVIGDEGSIVAYNMGFEKRVIKDLMEAFPSEKEFLNGLLDRFVDLLIPFRNFHYYDPRQKGSCSIKDVLPCLVDKDYSSLEIAKGDEASAEYLRMQGVDDGERQRIRENLLEYCKLDTEAMVDIYEKLKELCE